MTEYQDRQIQSTYMYDAAALPKNSRIIIHLTPLQAVEIFMFRPDISLLSRKETPSGAQVGRLYGVSEKTIRDIWTGRTWKDTTAHLDKNRPITVPKGRGRPKGSTDGKPRKRQDKPGRSSFHLKTTKIHGNQTPAEKICFCGSIDDQLFEWERQSSFPFTQSDPFRLPFI